MRIAQLAPPFESVPPRHYGGTERVIATLVEEFVRRGHEVTLFASGDSRSPARLVPTVDEALWHLDPGFDDVGPFWPLVLGKVIRRMQEADVIHSHLDVFGLPLVRVASCPVVTTLHGRLDRPELGPVFAEFAEAPLVSISRAQRRPLPRAGWAANIYHGIRVESFTFGPSGGDYLAFLGRVSPEKGLDVAIRVAQRTGMPLKIAARIPELRLRYPEVRTDVEYYETVVRPLLDRTPNAEMLGTVGETGKNELLSHAAALILPIRWPEPFGLVMPEALACGTPVLACRRGSVPELIEDGVTGFVCDDEDGLVEAVGRIPEIRRADCRASAERRFTAATMADQYERLFERLIREAL